MTLYLVRRLLWSVVVLVIVCLSVGHVRSNAFVVGLGAFCS